MSKEGERSYKSSTCFASFPGCPPRLEDSLGTRLHHGTVTSDLFVPLPNLPKVVVIQFWLHVLLAIAGYERDFKEMVSHEVKCLLDPRDDGRVAAVLRTTAIPVVEVVRLEWGELRH